MIRDLFSKEARYRRRLAKARAKIPTTTPFDEHGITGRNRLAYSSLVKALEEASRRSDATPDDNRRIAWAYAIRACGHKTFDDHDCDPWTGVCCISMSSADAEVELRRAIDVITSAAGVDDASADDLYTLQWLYQELEDDHSACEVCQRLVGAYPKHEWGWECLATLSLMEDDLEQSVRARSRYAELRPNDARAWRDYARALNQLGRNDEALEVIRRARRLDPQNTDYHYQETCCLIDLGRVEEAYHVVKEASDIQPNHAGVRTSLGNMLVRLDRFEEAIEIYREAIRLAPSSLHTYIKAAECYQNLAMPENALALLRAAQKRTKGDLSWEAGELGHAFEKMGQFEEAEALYNSAKKWGGRADFSEQRDLIRVLKLQGKSDDALKAYTESLPRLKEMLSEFQTLESQYSATGSSSHRHAGKIIVELCDAVANLAAEAEDAETRDMALECMLTRDSPRAIRLRETLTA